MQVLKRELVSAGRDAAPRGRIMRLQMRASLDALTTLAVTALAVAMAVGYQVFRRRAAGSSAP
jgi:hypothetical protein